MVKMIDVTTMAKNRKNERIVERLKKLEKEYRDTQNPDDRKIADMLKNEILEGEK